MPFIWVSMLSVLTRCAKIGSDVDGGIMDEYPPVVVEAQPGNRSLHFDKKRVEIEFDEFIQLNSVNQELVVSPPLEERPVVRMRNKTMIIDLDEELRSSTTYTFNFGRAIADLNEGNVLENFEYVFSTGDYIDSLSVGGSIRYAFDLKVPEDPFTIMLFENLNDSAPYQEKPIYVGKSNSRGVYRINNLKAGTFRLFALKDANNNFLYDITEEEIGFLDTLLILDPDMFADLLIREDTARQFLKCVDLLGDTLLADTNRLLEADTAGLVLSDSAYLLSLNPYTIIADISVFREDNEPQYLRDYDRPVRRRISLIFNRPLAHELNIEPVNFEATGDWYIREDHFVGDTVDFWLRDSAVYRKDTLLARISYYVTDTLANYVSKTDTLRFRYAQPTRSEKGKRRKDALVQPDTSLMLIPGTTKGGIQRLNQAFTITAGNPVASIDTNLILLSYKPDTISHRQEFELSRDSFFLREYRIKAGWQEDMVYKLFIAPGAMTDIYGLTNDTLEISFRTKMMENYGRIMLNVTGISDPMIVQLLTKEDEPIRQSYLDSDGTVNFDYLDPDSYRIKIIHDRNTSGKWDAGCYLEGMQPEKVVYYQGLIEIRANWEKEILWNLEE